MEGDGDGALVGDPDGAPEEGEPLGEVEGMLSQHSNHICLPVAVETPGQHFDCAGNMVHLSFAPQFSDDNANEGGVVTSVPVGGSVVSDSSGSSGSSVSSSGSSGTLAYVCESHPSAPLQVMALVGSPNLATNELLASDVPC